MRDPDLVLRAEHAANALEQAWLHWRARHGLEAGPLPPVSSYVGYSLEEPWGQPRVVFGIGAAEAEQLAAMLNGHDRVGLARAGFGIRPEPRYADAAPPAWTIPGDTSGPLGRATTGERVPATAMPSPTAGSARFAAAPPMPAPAPALPAARVPAPSDWASSDRASSDRASSDRAASDPTGPESAAREPAARGLAGPGPAAGDLTASELTADDLTAEQPILPRVLRQAAALADQPADLPADTAARLQELAARPAGPASAAAGPDSAGSPVSSAGQRGIVAFRGRSAAGPGQPEFARDPMPPGEDSAWVWSDADSDAARPEARTAESAGGQRPEPATARLVPVSRLNRQRKPSAGPADPGPWPPRRTSKQAPTDTAV